MTDGTARLAFLHEISIFLCFGELLAHLSCNHEAWLDGFTVTTTELRAYVTKRPADGTPVRQEREIRHGGRASNGCAQAAGVSRRDQPRVHGTEADVQPRHAGRQPVLSAERDDSHAVISAPVSHRLVT